MNFIDLNWVVKQKLLRPFTRLVCDSHHNFVCLSYCYHFIFIDLIFYHSFKFKVETENTLWVGNLVIIFMMKDELKRSLITVNRVFHTLSHDSRMVLHFKDRSVESCLLSLSFC